MNRRLDKTLFRDSSFTIFDNADRTKKVQFQVSEVMSGQTRTLTIPDADGVIAHEHHIPLVSEGVVIEF